MSGRNEGTGTALAEVYHLRESPVDPSAPRLTNLSMRGYSGSGTGPLVVGFVVDGDRPRQYLVRAIGPSLTDFGLPGTLLDPRLMLFERQRLLASATTDTTARPQDYDKSLVMVAEAVGGFTPLRPEPVLVVWLNPGIYTALVEPRESLGGVALAEVYEIPFDARSN